MLSPKKASVSFHGGAGSVTGANFLLEGGRTRLLVDCGLIQGEKFAEELNRADFPYHPVSIDFLCVTHAHIDHIGRIPKLVHEGFRGTIISTPETKALSLLMLPDALAVMRAECEEGEPPLYEAKDITQTLSLWKTVSYHEPFSAGEFEVVFKDAGHILGSAMIALAADKRGLDADNRRQEKETPRTIVFTGDLGNSPSPLLRDTEPITDATYLVMESVYGDRNHENKDERRKRLSEVIRRAAARGGVLLIPCFSVEKTQVLLHEMNDLLQEKEIPKVPVYLDSPLSIKVTGVYRSHSAQFNAHARQDIAQGDDIFKFPNLTLTAHATSSGAIAHRPNPKIIIAGSGMSAGGRIVEHERRYLGEPNNTILFVGYQAAGSFGRQIQEGVKRVQIGSEDARVRAKVETIHGYSSHKDSAHLLEFVAHAAEGGALQKVFLTMGEPKAASFLAQRIRDYVGVEAVVPQLGDRVALRL